MRVLVVGGAGYIGNEVCKQLDSAGIEHTVYDNYLYHNSPPDYGLTTNIEGDVRNSDGLAAIIEYHDAVIWLAAIVGEPACGLIPEEARQINTDSLQVLSQFRGKRVVFTSTASVYGIAQGEINERHALNPLGVYGTSKVQAESFLRTLDNNVAICRLGTAFGIRPYTRKRFDLSVNAMTRDAILKGLVRVWGGNRKRPFIHIQDIAKTIIRLLLNCDYSGTINVSACNLSLLQLAELVAIETGVVIKCYAIDNSDNRDYEIDTGLGRSLALFDPQSMFSIKSGVEEISAWVQNHHNYNGITTNFEALAKRISCD